MAWLPYGVVGIPIVWETPTVATRDPKNADEKEPEAPEPGPQPEKPTEQTDSDGMAHYWVLSVFSEKLGKGLDDLTWKAVCSWNTEYGSKFPDDKMWKSRMKVLEQLQGEVKRVSDRARRLAGASAVGACAFGFGLAHVHGESPMQVR